MEPFLESSWTPLFLTYAISKLLANVIGKMYRLYVLNTSQIKLLLPISMATLQVQVTIMTCMDS